MRLGAGLLIAGMVLAQADAGVAAPADPADSASGETVPEAVLEGDPSLDAPAPTAPAPTAPAQAAPAQTAPAVDDTPDPRLLALQPASVRLFNALKSGASDEDVEKLVTATVIELDMNCPKVKEFQVYRASTRARTLKIKCEERPVYAVTVGVSGEAFVAGGDGTIGQMRLADGPIKPVLGIRVEEYLANTKRQQNAEDAAERAAAEGGHPVRIWLIRLAWLAGIGLVLWFGAVFARERLRQRQSHSRWHGLGSDAKDQMIEESEEIYPNLYRHPSGVFIARGRRGKRRIFASLVFAYLYSSRGIKLFEIR